MVAKKKTSVEDTISDFFKDKKDKPKDDLFDVGASVGLVNISLSRITQDKDQPRKTFDEKTIGELSDSIKEQGIINPITVRPDGEKFVIVAGERRFLAARKAGLKVVPAVIREVSKSDVMLISLIENLQREDLNSIDRAEGINALKVNLGLPWAGVARKLGLSKQRILDLVGLLNLPDEIKEDIKTRRLTEKHGRALRKLKGGKNEILKMSKIVKDKKLSGDDALKLAKEVKTRFGSRSVYSENDTAKVKSERNHAWKLIKTCKNLLSEIKDIKTSFSFHTEMTSGDKKELKDALLAVTRKIDDFIKTYNL
jgi:ParB family transcriptional regulator, chromosome partitioning protein